MSTDSAWEAWGQREPYFGVITNPKFRKSELTPEAKEEFFASGHAHVEHVMQMIRQYVDPVFRPHAILDFGCGVGRLVVPFAKLGTVVFGTDVSVAMLDEARKNCAELGITNVELLRSDDELSVVNRKFDLVHSYIVFQHIPADRGRVIFTNLLRLLPARGVGAIHVSYSKVQYEATHGLAPPPPIVTGTNRAKKPAAPTPAAPGADPEMQMNPYHLNELLFMMQRAGVRRFHAELTDHGGELGVFLFFQKS